MANQSLTEQTVEFAANERGSLAKKPAQYIYRKAAWIVIPIILLLVFPSPWMSVGFVASLVLFLLRWIAYGSPFPTTRANLPLLILLVMTTIGFARSSAPDLAVITAGQIVAGVTVLFVLLDTIHSIDDLWHATILLLLLGVVFAFAAPFTVHWSANKLFGLPEFYDRIWPRLPKETNPNILAGAIAPIVPIALALIAKGDGRWRALGAISLAPLILVLVLLQSRGALFALAGGLGVWLTLYRSWVLPLIAIALSAILLINTLSGGPSVASFLYGEVSTTSPNTFVQRQDLWIQSLYLIRQSPLLGIGLGAYPRVEPYAWPNSPTQPGSIESHTHNLFLQIALDTGILGLASFVVLLLVALRSVWDTYRAGIERHLTIGILAAFAAVLIHGLGDVVVWGTAKSSIVLWILLGLATRLDKVRKVV